MSDNDETVDRELHGFRIPGKNAFRGRLTLFEWQDLWKACKDYYSALGLLHGLYDACEGEKRGYGRPDYDTDRALFLLQLADFKNVEHHVDIRSKARNILAKHFFKTSDRDGILYMQPALQKALQTFFMNRNVWWDAESRHDASHTDRVMSKYLQDFCRVLVRKGSGEFRVWLTDLAFTVECCQGAFEVLLPENLNSVSWNLFDEAVLARLEELALANSETVEDALSKGSCAARALVIVRAGLAGKEREARAKELTDRMKRDTEALAALKKA